jgi:ubiquinone/menaquinone biosynthesis C-methylase UbiE
MRIAGAASREAALHAILYVMQFSEPKGNVLQMGLTSGMKVGELGAGSGHYALAAAHVVGPSGRVYAIDIQEDLLKRLTNSAHEQGLRNVETVWGNIEKTGGTKLRDNALDAVILANTLFQIEHREGLVKEVTRVLKPGGRFLVVDWAGSYGGVGPKPDHVVSEHKAEELFIGNGFYKVKSFPAGAHHYAIVFTKPD